ncbi:MAG: hypothetical protein WAU24_04865 [Chitinophagaceae bacterium]
MAETKSMKQINKEKIIDKNKAIRLAAAKKKFEGYTNLTPSGFYKTLVRNIYYFG